MNETDIIERMCTAHWSGTPGWNARAPWLSETAWEHWRNEKRVWMQRALHAALDGMQSEDVPL